MFTAKDLTVGDLVATYRLTVSDVHKLDAAIWNKAVYSVKGESWDSHSEREYFVQEDRVLEVWE